VTPKPPPVIGPPPQSLPAREGNSATIDRGEVLYNRYCGRCHAFGRALLPDLRQISPVTHQLFYQIVLKGIYQGKGMGRWDDVLSTDDAQAIHAYLVDQAWQLRSETSPAKDSPP
jgi:quinohemoprotein ethanol dehydrogenase